METSLEDRVALVTGASSGIGREVALALARAGADVCLQGLSQMEAVEAAAATIIKMGRRAIAVKANVSLTEDVDRLVRIAVQEFCGVDIAVNNAGIFRMATLEEPSDEIFPQ